MEVFQKQIKHFSSHISKKEITSSHWLKVCLAIGILSLWFFISSNIEHIDLTFFVPRVRNDVRSNARSHTGYLVNTKGCRIPDLDPMDPSIRQFTIDNSTLDCAQQYGPPLVYSDVNRLYINQSALRHYAPDRNVDIADLSCCYKPFWREVKTKPASYKTPPRSWVKVVYAKECRSFQNKTLIEDEFIKVECFINDYTVYIDFHSFPQLKNDSEKKSSTLKKPEAVSVLMVGVDAVSRLNFYRQMPKTLHYLRNLGAVEMLGYNKVHDNTFPNLVPVLAGLSENELKAKCWPTAATIFDDCNFIWNNFSDAGFKTAFGEDSSWMGMFNYVKRGFYKQPTDYYMNVFNLESERRIGFEKRFNTKLCVGPRKALETLLSYAYKFAYKMKGVLSFGFFWGASLTHDFLNYPKFGDVEHKDFLKDLFESGVLNNTVLIFMSDHGIRWGGIRKTYQGYLEERLPFLFVSYPDWFRIRYTTAVSNLKRNVHRLTTHFDLHEVLLDLVNLTRLSNKVLKRRSEELLNAKVPPRGISLFLPISGDRKCEDAGISEHWCTCHHSVEVSVNDKTVKHAAEFLVKNINSLLSNYAQCAPLNLSKVVSSREEVPLSHSGFTSADADIKDFSLIVETLPGNGLFEAMVRHNGNTGNFSSVGSTSRVNLYGDQSKCVSNYKLKLYCYCING